MKVDLARRVVPADRAGWWVQVYITEMEKEEDGVYYGGVCVGNGFGIIHAKGDS